jgi:hypothetical protein
MRQSRGRSKIISSQNAQKTRENHQNQPLKRGARNSERGNGYTIRKFSGVEGDTAIWCNLLQFLGSEMISWLYGQCGVEVGLLFSSCFPFGLFFHSLSPCEHLITVKKLFNMFLPGSGFIRQDSHIAATNPRLLQRFRA